MPSAGQSIVFSRLLILSWVILWLTTVPLFHTHLPDLSDGPASASSGLAHTVFSSDLPGEFSRPAHVSEHEPSAHISNRISSSPELNFVLSSEDPPSRRLGEPTIVGIGNCLSPRPFAAHSASKASTSRYRPHLFAARQGPRAPPVVVSS